ncbi:MAG: DUF4338 domain-containing protein [Chloroflexi bacterium]|nr:DUF4338 domain-containing protein [Chloroflexota bacterium]
MKRTILRSLKEQGFRVSGIHLLPPDDLNKEGYRRLHRTAVAHKLEASRPALIKYQDELQEMIASGREVVPERIHPTLVEVKPGSRDELLFRYVTLHWSIPVSSGYGRRLRFLVVDDFNGKLIGALGLGDPVFDLRYRDRWIGWTREDRRERLHQIMDAFVLGAVPPYSYILCGKLVAMLVGSNQVREAFHEKYSGRTSRIRKRPLASQLVAITTTSALGRSSIYNRLRFRGRNVFQSVGYTQGSGEFHFANGLYTALSDFAARHCDATAKHSLWGNGFRNRREIVKKSLPRLGLPSEWVYHGVQREIFIVPIAENAKQVLRGEETQPVWFDQSSDDLSQWCKERWIVPRAHWDQRYQEFDPDSYRLWS